MLNSNSVIDEQPTGPGELEPPAGIDSFDASPSQEVAQGRFPERWSIDTRSVLLLGWLCLSFLIADYLPLAGGRLWGDIAAGRWILDHGTVPGHDPLVSLVEGVPVVPSRWLAQVGLAAVGSMGNDELFTHLFAILSVVGTVLLVDAFRRFGGSFNTALAAIVLVSLMSMCLPRLAGADLFGWFVLAIFLWIRAFDERRRPEGSGGWGALVATPVFFAAWANLHETFLIGIAWLACRTLGEAVEWWSATTPASRRQAAGRFHHALVLTELACVGTLFNPAGIDLLLDRCGLLTLVHESFQRNPQPLLIGSWAGLPLFVLLLLTGVMLRWSRLPIRPQEVFSILMFGGWALLNVDSMMYLLPVLMTALIPHLADLLGVCVRGTDSAWIQSLYKAMTYRSARLTLAAGLLVWFAFVFSPISQAIMGGKPRLPKQYLRSDIPLEATEFLAQKTPRGLIAAPADWGDWLLARGPEEVSVMLTTQAEQIAPRQVRNDYQVLMDGRPGLERILERYRINVVLADNRRQGKLVDGMDQLAGWKRVYEDRRASAYIRDGSSPPETEGASSDSAAEVPET